MYVRTVPVWIEIVLLQYIVIIATVGTVILTTVLYFWITVLDGNGRSVDRANILSLSLSVCLLCDLRSR
jgi:hypothetical protein